MADPVDRGATLFDEQVTVEAGRKRRESFLRWRKKLNELSAGRDDAVQYRTHLLAEYVMAGQYEDLKHRDSDISGLFNESVRTDVMGIYHQAAEFMPYLKGFQAKGVPQPEAWVKIREKLEKEPFLDE